MRERDHFHIRGSQGLLIKCHSVIAAIPNVAPKHRRKGLVTMAGALCHGAILPFIISKDSVIF